MTIMFDTIEGSTDVIKGKCFVQPKTELMKESIAKGAGIEIDCAEVPECKDKVCAQPFEIEAEILYEPFKYEREALRVKREALRVKPEVPMRKRKRRK